MRKLIYVLYLGLIFAFAACNSGEACHKEEETQSIEFPEKKSKNGACCAATNSNDSILSNNNH